MGEALVTRRGGGITLTKWAKYTITQRTTGQWVYTSTNSGTYSSLRSTVIYYSKTLNGPYYAITISDLYDSGATTGFTTILEQNGTQSYRITAVRPAAFDYSDKYTYTNSTSSAPGTLLKYVYASESDAYPANGTQNGYWYIKQ